MYSRQHANIARLRCRKKACRNAKACTRKRGCNTNPIHPAANDEVTQPIAQHRQHIGQWRVGTRQGKFCLNRGHDNHHSPHASIGYKTDQHCHKQPLPGRSWIKDVWPVHRDTVTISDGLYRPFGTGCVIVYNSRQKTTFICACNHFLGTKNVPCRSGSG